MKPLNHHVAAVLLMAAALTQPALMQQAHAATPTAPTSTLRAEASPGFSQIMTMPFDSELPQLSTPVKYGLLLIGLSLMEKLSRRTRY